MQAVTLARFHRRREAILATTLVLGVPAVKIVFVWIGAKVEDLFRL